MLYGTRIALAGECPSWTLWIPLPVRTGRPDCQPPSLWHRPCFSPSATTARNAGEPHCEASCAGRRRSLRSLLLSAHWHCCRSALRWTLRPGTEVPPPFGFGVGVATPPLPIGSLGAAYRSTTPDNLNMGQFKISGCWRFVCGSPLHIPAPWAGQEIWRTAVQRRSASGPLGESMRQPTKMHALELGIRDAALSCEWQNALSDNTDDGDALCY